MSDQPQSVKSAQRALELLEVIASYPDGVSFVDLADRLQYPRSSLHGLLSTIVAMKWLVFDPQHRIYSIGVRPWEIGQSFRRSRDLVVRARRYIREAHSVLNETVQLGILDDLDVVYIDKVEGTQPLRLVSNIGSRLPAYVTGIGKALLMGVPSAVLRERYDGKALTRYTPQTLSTVDDLIAVIEISRERGYATDDGEYTDGVFCVAVPIVGPAGDIVASISCSVPRARIDSGQLTSAKMIGVLTQSAQDISAALAAEGADVPAVANAGLVR